MPEIGTDSENKHMDTKGRRGRWDEGDLEINIRALLSIK